MFVVRTISQLEEAVRGSAKEVLVVGKLAPEMLEMKALSSENCKKTAPASTNVFIAKLCEDFNVSEVRDNSENLLLVLSQRNGNSGSIAG